MSAKDKKQGSAGEDKRPIGKVYRKGKATFGGILPDSHPIYQSGTRVGFRSKPRPRPAAEESSDK